MATYKILENTSAWPIEPTKVDFKDRIIRLPLLYTVEGAQIIHGDLPIMDSILHVDKHWPANADSSYNYLSTSISAHATNNVGILTLAKSFKPLS